jgi:type I restriction enzyme S subunit
MASKKKPTATNVVAKAELTPKLRFPQFTKTETWKDIPIHEILNVRDERRIPSADIPLYSLTIENGITAKTDRYNREFLVTNAETKKYKLVKPNDIVYNPSNLRWGAINFSQLSHAVVVSPIYEVLHLTEDSDQSLNFIACAVMRTEQINRFITKGQGTLIERVAVKIDDFLSTCLPIPPSLPEQQKIADCLSSLDDVIAEQGRKVDSLKTHKKGLMHQLFPREGETQPRLRFPEFRKAGEWDNKRLCEIVDIKSGATPSKDNTAFWNGSVPWISAKDMKRLFLDDAQDHISQTAVDDGARLAPQGTLLILTRGMTLLRDVPICVLCRNMSFNQDVKGLYPKDGVHALFLAWLLVATKQRLLEMVTIAGHGTGKLETEELKGLDLMMPLQDEQQCIAECLTNLDNLISYETQKLDALKAHKKGLMQQIFPSTTDTD